MQGLQPQRTTLLLAVQEEQMKLIYETHEWVKDRMRELQPAVDVLVEELLEHQDVQGERVHDIYRQYGPVPA
jgi:hypothetical protein